MTDLPQKIDEKMTRQTFADRLLSLLEGPGLAAWFVLIIIYGLVMLGAGWAGIDDAAGSLWAFLALFAATMFRFTLPITIGAFLAAVNLWEWHWFFALIFVAPGLLFMVPGLLVALVMAYQEKKQKISSDE